ncbi:MAG TPA: XdhC family protein [Desulfitobacterium dehalogenans]|uniref:XdhC family protein n=1 Tax=Desulfitobacterium dehalogenans TaxID=36854 RepID=A0A7C7D5G5_9FIRM|nr:XdhC family protein [Desulfitobacterium dehalogenans]
MDKEIKMGLRHVLEEKLEAALITVTKVLGSAPRKPGAQMLVLADGTTTGTIGGGCGEAEARQAALQVLSTGRARKHSLNMTADIAEDEGMVCGGIMELFIDYLGQGNVSEQLILLENYLLSFNHGESPVLVTLTESKQENIGQKLVIQKNNQYSGDLGLPILNRIALEQVLASRGHSHFSMVNLDEGFNPCDTKAEIAYQLLLEPPVSETKLVILGAGHIGLPLAGMGKMLGYEVTVVDDRPSFANTLRFRTADRVICNDFEKALADLVIDPQTYVVIVTRGHRHDKVCLKNVIHKPAGYIGMIGSRRRVKAMLAELQEEGIPAEKLEKLYSPIGLKIGAETPEEIAVCILGEIIKVQKEQTVSINNEEPQKMLV